MSTQAQPVPTAATSDRDARWQEDVQYFVSRFSESGYAVDFRRGISTRGQKDFSKLYPPADFNSAVERLKSDIPSISDEEIVLRLMRLVASANVAHNSVLPKGRGFSLRLPLGFSWFPDGLAVTSATPEYSLAQGARVVKIGSMTPDQLLSELGPYVSHENVAWLRRKAQGLMATDAVLRHFDLVAADGHVTITLEKPGSAQFTISPAFTESQAEQIPFSKALNVPTPLFLSRAGTYYWYQYLDDSETLYVQYNRCNNDPSLPFKDFTQQLFAEADRHRVKRVVVDLRLNGGGDSRVIGPLKSGLASRARSVGHVYVLIGTGTFSSALMNAIDLHRDLNASLVGEPTGGAPSGYGEIKQLVLPNSKVVVNYTSKYFGDPKDNSTALDPDIPAPRTLADAVAGRDPALQAAIAAP